MKKILFVVPVLILMAAGCNSQNPQTVSTAPLVQPSSTPTPTEVMITPTPTATPTTNSKPAAVNPAPTQPSNAPAPQVNLVLRAGISGSLGQYLTANNGMALYTSSQDAANISHCTGACASSWPPYTVTIAQSLVASPGISGKLGTITRADGTKQMTYNGMPLYFWSQDKQTGDTTGNAIGGFSVAKP